MTDETHIAKSRERFVQETAEHRMTVLRDDDLYRHLRFQRPNDSFYWFDLVTWPGVLCINGDCGTFVFSRTRDMFEFFRTGKMDDPRWGINPHYWAEKLRAPESSAARRYSEDAFKARVREWRDEMVEHHFDPPELLDDEFQADIDKFRADVQEQLLDHDAYSADEAHRLLRDFEGREEPADAWEWDFTEYDWQFLWCCWAIVYGIGQYDKATTEPVAS